MTGSAWSAQKDLGLLWGKIKASSFSVLLVFVPLGLVAGIFQFNALFVFGLNLVALIPMALLLGDVTEDLAEHYGDVVGGLLNATFGNVVEVVLAIAALRKGLFTVVSSSLLGSILSNLLLVLGSSMLVGGIFTRNQQYNTESSAAHSTLLFLAVIGIAIPTSAPHIIDDMSAKTILQISHVSAVVMMCCYICYLIFQLITHPEVVPDEDDDGHVFLDEEGSESKDAHDLISVNSAICLMLIISAVVAINCEFLTDVIVNVTEATGISQAFIGMIVLPIAGNACEHTAAVVMAAKNKMDLSLGIAIGSSLQISLFAIPFVVLVGWGIQENFSLDIDLFALLVLLFSVIHANLIIATGRSNWLTGVTLVSVYVLIATTYFCQSDV